jgi:hypothetical protein
MSFEQETQPASIGTAFMSEDGTISLSLRASGPAGMVGDARLTYPPSHPQYAEILRHLGDFQPGQSKSVPPWAD